MNQEQISKQLIQWMQEFVEIPHPRLGNWPPCPYARQARLNNGIGIKFCTVPEFDDVLGESLQTLEQKEVVVICFDHRTVAPDVLQQYVQAKNQVLMPIDYVILEDHPDAEEFVNGIKMNFRHCGLLVLQKLSKLNTASDRLKEKGYYKHWDQQALDEVVNWRK
jgi:hypothetical protein